MSTQAGGKGGITSQQIGDFYDTGSPVYMEAISEHIHDGYYIASTESPVAAQENLVRLLAEKARITAGDRVLDVGCGVGGGSVWLAKNTGAITTGITISPVQVVMARELAEARNANSTFMLMNAEDMKFNERFDVIWVTAAVTHFKNQEEFFKSAARYLGRDGRLVLFDWMTREGLEADSDDADVKRVIKEMLLAGLFPMNSYIKWLTAAGFNVNVAEDITDHTLKTWEMKQYLSKKAALLNILSRFDTAEIGAVLHLVRAVLAIRSAMKKGKIRSGIIAAQKI